MAIDERLRDPATDRLFAAVLSLRSLEECYRFFEDVCTVAEIKALAQRLEVATMLSQGLRYDDIVAATGASTATISRVKRCLHYGADGYRLVLERLSAAPTAAEHGARPAARPGGVPAAVDGRPRGRGPRGRAGRRGLSAV